MHTQQKELEREGEIDLHYVNSLQGYGGRVGNISPLAVECMTDLRDIEGGWELDLLFSILRHTLSS